MLERTEFILRGIDFDEHEQEFVILLDHVDVFSDGSSQLSKLKITQGHTVVIPTMIDQRTREIRTRLDSLAGAVRDYLNASPASSQTVRAELGLAEALLKTPAHG